MRQVAIKDLQPIHGSAHSAPRPGLQKLTDAELLESVRNPPKGDFLMENTRTGGWLTATVAPTNCSAGPPTPTAVSSLT